jgi:hypothetical protein
VAWHAVELATTSANVAAAILIKVIFAGHDSDRAHPKEKPRGEEAGPWKFVGPEIQFFALPVMQLDNSGK